MPRPRSAPAAAILAAFASTWLATTAAAQTVNDPRLVVEVVATGLTQPTQMAFLAERDILVLQKSDGRVRRILDGVLLPDPVLDVAVHFSSERGLLGIAVDPEFADNRRVYLYYTESATGSDTNSSGSTPLGNRIYRYTWDGAALRDPVLIVDLPATPGPNHDGGILAFGPDGALYGVIGDLNRDGKLQNFPSGPDPDDTGVVLRVDTDGRGLPDNPFFDPAMPASRMNRYFAYGIRNSFGLAFDPWTGSMWDTENGPNSYDEINRVFPGFNSGWEQIMGPDARDPQGTGDLWVAPGSRYADPAFSWASPVAPTALVFVRSPIMGCGLVGDLLVGDNNCGQISRFRLNAARDDLAFTSTALLDRVADNGGATCTSSELTEIRFGSGFGVITDLENGPDGRIYLLSLSRGTLYRIGPQTGLSTDRDGDGVDDDCDCAPSDASAFAVPREVERLRVSGSALRWESQAATAGPGTTATIVGGDLAALRRDRDYGGACTLATGAAPPFTDARALPPAGSGHHYLARAENVCGVASFGDATLEPDPRDALDAALPAACACAERGDGALIRFRIVDETLSVWITDGVFIDRALELLATGTTQIPVFQTLLDGRDCDSQWTWHVDPAAVSFTDAAIELCDGKPSHVEADKDYWLNTVGSYCPWSAVVDAVDDRR
jgi:glucose/arabinose dehydrogenase